MLRTAIRRKISLIGLLAFMASVGAPIPSIASVEGRRNTAIGLTAASIYSLVRGHGRTGIVLGAGSAYAWKRYKDAKKGQKVYRSNRFRSR